MNSIETIRTFFRSPSKVQKGIALVIMGHFVYWSLGFQLGFWEFFSSTMIVSTAFFILCACQSEMTGILPFSGGAYGFARVTTGPYLGFVVGFFDSVSNILYVTLYVRSLVDFILMSFSLTSPHSLYPLWWFLVYLGMFLLHIVLNKYSFKFISVMGFICLMVPLIYIFGTSHLQDFKTNVTDMERMVHHQRFKGGAAAFMGIVPFSSILYFGVDMICLACEDTRNASVVVPQVIMAVMSTLFVLAIILIFCVASQPPGILGAGFIALPLNMGFMTMFKTTFEYATVSILPSYFIINYAIMYVYGRQMCALARSNLLPRCFAWTTSIGNVPYMAIALGNFLGMVVVLWQWFGTEDSTEFSAMGKDLFYTAQMCSVSVYIISMLSFIVFRYKYSTLQRRFVNYLGIPSALVGISIFVFLWIALAFYQFNYFPIKCFSALFGLASVYYFSFARFHQRFSPEEESILLTVYVIKANSKHRTMYKWIEKRLVRWINRVDPHRKFFRKLSSNSDSKKKKTGSSSDGGAGSGPKSGGGSKGSGDGLTQSPATVGGGGNERKSGGSTIERVVDRIERDMSLMSAKIVSRKEEVEKASSAKDGTTAVPEAASEVAPEVTFEAAETPTGTHVEDATTTMVEKPVEEPHSELDALMDLQNKVKNTPILPPIRGAGGAVVVPVVEDK